MTCLRTKVKLFQKRVHLLPSSMPLDVLLVDDHKIMRDGIKAILSRSEEFRIAGEAENGTDAVQLCRRLRPQIVLMDIGLPGLNGVETTQEILRFHPECKIVGLSMYDDENSVMGAIRAGAKAFILKRAPAEQCGVGGVESPGTTSAAFGGRGQDQQGDRDPFGVERTDRAQLPQN